MHKKFQKFINKLSDFRPTLIVKLSVSLIALSIFVIFGSRCQHNLPTYLNGTISDTGITRSEPVTLLAVGDIMLSRSVEDRMWERNDYTYPFLEVAELTRNADLAFANLETPITKGERVASGEMRFHANPETLQGLEFAGFDIVSLANNHMGDAGQQGLADTFKYLAQSDINFVGAGENTAQACLPKYLTVKGTKFAFLAYTDSSLVPQSYGASADSAGTCFMDTEELENGLALAKQQAAFVIVSMHSGTEYVTEPTGTQADFAHAAVDIGADLVIGHHPHVIQTHEVYKNKHIFYSLGNFVFDQMWSSPTRQGLAVEFTIENNEITNINYHPVLIENYAQPNFILNANDKESVLNKLE